jgi:hypothetical protein
MNQTRNQTHTRRPRSRNDSGHDTGHHSLHRRDRGQATTEYALVLLAAALVGVLVVGWATSGGGAAAIGRLFDSAIDSVIDQL